MARWLGPPRPEIALSPDDVGPAVPGRRQRMQVLTSAAWLPAAPAPCGAELLVLPEGCPDALAADCGGAAVLRMACPESAALYLLRRTLARLCAARVVIHGVMCEVFGLGVLIIGASAQGKSELALELLSRGHGLIADDAVELVRADGVLVGHCPWLLRGFLEVRGLGILDVARMFGPGALRRPHRLDLIVHLFEGAGHVPEYAERLRGLRRSREILGLPVDEISLPVRVGHNLATLMEAACRDHWLRLAGYRADEAFADRQQQAIDLSQPRAAP